MSSMINEIPTEIDEKLHQLAKVIEINWHQLREATVGITKKHQEEHEGPWPISEQYLKIYEETGEAYKAYMRTEPDEDVEHMDIFFSMLTLSHRRNKTRACDVDSIYACLVKFHKKGWLL